MYDLLRSGPTRLRLESRDLERGRAAGGRGPAFSTDGRNQGMAVALVALCVLAACSDRPPTRDRDVPADPRTVATITVRNPDGTPARGAEVALAEVGDWTQVAPVCGRTDAEGCVVLRCVRACRVQAWKRNPPAMWLEPSIDLITYIEPGGSAELRLTAVAFAALDVQPASPCYATLERGSPLPLLPGLLSARPAMRGGWRFVVAPSSEAAAAPVQVRLAAAGRTTTVIDLTTAPARDGAPVVVDLANLAPRPWAAPRLEVALPSGELLGADATELIRRALWLYDGTAGEVFFAGEVRNGMPGRIHVPCGRFVVRMNLLGEVTECWSGPIAADTDSLRIVLPKDLRPVEVTLRGLLAWPVDIVVQVDGTVHRAGDAPSTLFGLDARELGDAGADAGTTRLVLMVPPGNLTIGLREANQPHRPIGAPQPLRIDAVPTAAPARITIDVPPR